MCQLLKHFGPYFWARIEILKIVQGGAEPPPKVHSGDVQGRAHRQQEMSPVMVAGGKQRRPAHWPI
jgi:hypothetical protein